ncbi:MAG: DUF1566 domain-containing protein [Alphaproteobacteria bacterium]|nr:DUF1566 domain-containing protein [Alphaproteobacteria bacterium]
MDRGREMMTFFRSFHPHPFSRRHQGGAKRQGTSTKRSANGLRPLKPSPPWGEVFLTTVFCFLFSVFGLPASARADCLTPAGVAGEIVFNASHSLMQYCDGTNWIAMGSPTGQLNDGLVGHWKLDETSGTTATDSSGNGNDGTMQGGLSADNDAVTGVVGGALDLDGAGQYISAGDPVDGSLDPTGDATFAYWAYFNPGETRAAIICKNESYCIRHRDTTIWFSLWPTTIETAAITHNMMYDSWHHYALTFDGTTGDFVFYIDGQPFYNDTMSHRLLAASGDFLIGRVFWDTQYDLSGKADDIRIYDRALSPSEILLLYEQQANPCPNIGDTCPDGSIFAGFSPDGNVRMYTTPADASGAFKWNNGTGNWIDLTGMTNCTNPYNQSSCLTGETNTTYLVALSDASSPYQAALYCHCLGKAVSGACSSDPTGGANGYGKSDWYLPASNELDALYDNLVDQNGDNTPGGPLGSTFGFNVTGLFPAGYYWSSSEDSLSAATRQRFNTGARDSFNKANDLSVRCVRKDTSASCMNPVGATGEIVFNADRKIMQYCNGETWVGMGSPEGQLKDGLVGWWKLDETSGGTIADATGNNDGTWDDNDNDDVAEEAISGPSGGALDFDGTDDFVEVDSGVIGTGAVSVSLWLNPAASGGYYTIVAEADPGPTYRFVCTLMADGMIDCDNELASGAHATTSSVIPVNQWTHFAVVRAADGVTYNLYLNGVLTGGADQVITPAAAGGSVFWLGTRTGEFFQGKMDNVRIYNRALSASDVSLLYETTKPAGPLDGLVGWWKLDETSGTTAVDSSGNGNDGTMQSGLDAGSESTPGKIGTALDFDGVDDRIEIGDDPVLNPADWTLSAWFRVDATTADGSQEIMCKSSAGDTNFDYCMNFDQPQNSFRCMYRNAGSWVIAQNDAVVVDIGRFYHGTCVYDSVTNTLSAYLDAALMEGQDGLGVTPPNTADPVLIGRRMTNSDEFNGKIDDVRIYNRALTADEIMEIYSLGLCTDPDGAAGEIVFNTSGGYNGLQYCNGAGWIGVGK